MTSSPDATRIDALPPALSSMWRLCKLGYRHEPALIVTAFALALLAATRRCTTILISHRFSTVRHADRICVIEHGRVVELGTHDELIALGGRYRTMFDLQAQRFGAAEDEEGTVYDVLA